MEKLRQFISTLKLTPNIKLFGVSFGSTDEFGAVEVKTTPNWSSNKEIPTSKAVKTIVDSTVNGIKSKVFLSAETASAELEGSLKYEKDATSSSLYMCMQTGDETYEWVLIKLNDWAE